MTLSRILCPVDFSDASRGALRYGAALAEHFGANLLVLTAIDPLLAEAAAMETSEAQVRASALEALRRFAAEAVDRRLKPGILDYEVAIGKPDREILRLTAERGVSLIVISSHGLTGFRKMFFGSITERVLRETPVPVLITSGDDRGPSGVADAAARVRRLLAPVLLPEPSAQQLAVTRALAEALLVPAVLLHVVEPLRAVLQHSDRYLQKVERERRERAERQLEALTEQAGITRIEGLIAYGEPSEEIVKVARDRNAGLIIVTLQGSALPGPRIGSVTYRVLCAAGLPVLALPPSRAHRAKAGKTSRLTQKSAARHRGRNRK